MELNLDVCMREDYEFVELDLFNGYFYTLNKLLRKAVHYAIEALDVLIPIKGFGNSFSRPEKYLFVTHCKTIQEER